MAPQSTGFSRIERRHKVGRPNARVAPDGDIAPLLCPRTTSARILGVSVPTIRRLEQAGVLDLVRLNPKKETGRALNRVAQVRALAEGNGSDA